MSLKRIGIAWMLGLALNLAAPGVHAESSKDFGDYVVHFNALATDMLTPEVAREYHITRSQNNGMVNITVLKKVLGSPGQPVHAQVEVTATNLTGQTRKIDMREVREGNAIYYIGVFGVTNEETVKFNVQIRPQGNLGYLMVDFSQDFYTH
jgi:Domain of unknown function (DUF4426)